MARTPVSPTPSCGSWEMKNTSAAARDFNSPSAEPSSRPRISSSISFRSTPLWQHAGGLGAEYEVASDDCAERLVGDTASRFVHDFQLGTQHPSLSGLVDGSKGSLPEPAPGRQERVVGDNCCLVGALGFYARAAELSVDFPRDLVERRLDVGNPVGLLAEDDLPDDGLDVGVRQCNCDREPVDELLEGWIRGECGLAGSYDEHLAVET